MCISQIIGVLETGENSSDMPDTSHYAGSSLQKGIKPADFREHVIKIAGLFRKY